MCALFSFTSQSNSNYNYNSNDNNTNSSNSKNSSISDETRRQVWSRLVDRHLETLRENSLQIFINCVLRQQADGHLQIQHKNKNNKYHNVTII